MDDPELAAGVLEHVRGVQQRVARHGARDWVVWAVWGLWVLVFIPPFDIVSGSAWGPIVLVSSIAGSLFTGRYYAKRIRQVRPLRPSRWGVWTVWGVWYVGWMVFAEVFSSRLAIAWTVAAVAAAVPLLVYAWHVGRRTCTT